MNGLLSLTNLLLSLLVVGGQGKKKVEAFEKFEYIREEPANELGIFTTVIAQVHRPANKTTEEWRLNKAFLPTDVYESLMDRCKTDPEDSPFKWRGCAPDGVGLLAFVTWGVPEPKNKTITYLQLEFKPFKKTNEKGKEDVCILDEVYKNKAFIVLKTYSELPANHTFPREPKDSVLVVHQHQLDAYGEHFLSIFGDKIDVEAIYNFGSDEYYDRDPPYECFLSIGSSESVAVIENKCDFYCPDPKGMSQQELENVLLQAKKEADEEMEHDSVEFNQHQRDEL